MEKEGAFNYDDYINTEVAYEEDRIKATQNPEVYSQDYLDYNRELTTYGVCEIICNVILIQIVKNLFRDLSFLIINVL